MINRRFFYFSLAGGTAALVNFGSRIAFSHFMAYALAIVLAYCLGMLTAFLLNRVFVFTDAVTPLRHQALWFVTINVAAVLQTLLVSLLLARWVFPWLGMTFHPEVVAHAFGVVVPVVTSYVGHKRLTFKAGPPRA